MVKFCPSCGAPLEGIEKYCTVCGEKLPPTAFSQQSPQPNDPERRDSASQQLSSAFTPPASGSGENSAPPFTPSSPSGTGDGQRPSSSGFIPVTAEEASAQKQKNTGCLIAAIAAGVVAAVVLLGLMGFVLYAMFSPTGLGNQIEVRWEYAEDALDHALERTEDALERTGPMQSLERTLEQAEHALEQAEDSLEQRIPLDID